MQPHLCLFQCQLGWTSYLDFSKLTVRNDLISEILDKNPLPADQLGEPHVFKRLLALTGFEELKLEESMIGSEWLIMLIT